MNEHQAAVARGVVALFKVARGWLYVLCAVWGAAALVALFAGTLSAEGAAPLATLLFSYWLVLHVLELEAREPKVLDALGASALGLGWALVALMGSSYFFFTHDLTRDSGLVALAVILAPYYMLRWARKFDGR